jgi:tetratricopeptide (TPR) repeat protein
MATYKKRGHKLQTKEEKQEAIEAQSATAEVFNTLDEGASKTEQWVAKNQKAILVIVGVIAVGVLGYLAYLEYVQKPKEIEASNEMFQAQTYFEQALNTSQSDSLYRLSLNGGQGKYGFLGIIENYGGTDAANLSKYYAGMAYLNTKNYKEAVSHLDDFKSGDAILGPIAKGAIGDAFMQLNQNEDALKYYKQAASMNENEFTSPKYLMKAGNLALQMGNAKEALIHFNKIKDAYSGTVDTNLLDAQIGKAEAMQ